MDLDSYKKVWNNQTKEINKISRADICKMIHSKSSSSVKWIFIIGIFEFIFTAIINNIFKINPNNYPKIDSFIIENMIWIEIISYLIMLYFLIQFYLNYKNINTFDSTKVLMKNILIVRETVKRYVFINVGFLSVISSFVLLRIIYINDLSFSIIILFIFLIIVILMLYWLFYQLLYGFLLKKLNANYKELSKLN